MKERVGYYRIAKLLGQGSAGSVYAADDEQLGRRVALKVIKRGPSGGDVDLERFRRESASLASVEHPSVVSVLEASVADGVAYVASEFVAGTDLGRLIAQRGKLGWPMAVKLATEISNGLEAIHAKGLVHGALKPANVLVDQRGRARITDFGLDAALAPEYLSPEQAGGKKADARTDLYGLGLVLFEMLTGDRPFSGNKAELEQKHISARPMSPRTLVPELPETLEALVMKLLAKSPEDRPASPREVVAQLRGLEELALPEPPPRRPGALVLVALAVVGVLFLLWRKAPEMAPPAEASSREVPAPRSVAGHIMLGRAFLSAHQVERALDEAEKAFALEPSSGEAHALRALVYRRQGEAEKAKKDASEAALILRLKLVALAGEKRWAEALAIVDVILELDPDDRTALADWWRLRGMVRTDAGDAAGGREDLERSRAIETAGAK